MAGRFVVPVVGYDGSSSGLSADGGTLVLMRPRMSFPQARTDLAILDPGTVRFRRQITLRGDFSFDAVSADGRWLYFIQYTSPVDSTRYRVRAMDGRTGRLLRRDIVDPHDRGEAMRGFPVTRTSSPDGRWAYTLYTGGERPFVHALDTASLRARCIDLPVFPVNSDPMTARLRLIPDQARLDVTGGRRTLASIDTRTMVVTDVALARSRPPARRAERQSIADGVPFGVVIAIVVAGALLVRHRSTGSPGSPGSPGSLDAR